MTEAMIHIRDLDIFVRKGTTDVKVVDEVIKRNVYEKPSIGFKIERGDRWLDLGANIGTFTLLCLSRGASVVAFEPEETNYHLLKKNVLENFGSTRRCRVVRAAVGTGVERNVRLFLARDEKNKYRHSLYEKRGRDAISVPHKNIYTVLDKYRPSAIKMDIEGSEIDILEALTPDDYRRCGVEKLVFEYSFDVDRSIPRFLSIVRSLRKFFRVVHYTKVREDEKEYNYFPAMTIVYCLV